jgi:uncharacterized protein (DUF2267 family)
MDAGEVYSRVEARLPETVDLNAEALTHVVLGALADRLAPEEAAEIGAELPDELGDILARAHGNGTLDREEFLEDLASRLDVDDDDAEAGASAVLTSLRELLEPMVAIDQILETLPPDLAQLMNG